METKFKVGDKVKIVRGFESNRHGNPFFNLGMESEIGRIGTVIDKTRKLFSVSTGPRTMHWWWPEKSLKLIINKKPNPSARSITKVYLNDKERKSIQNEMKRLGYTSRSEYIRACIEACGAI